MHRIVCLCVCVSMKNTMVTLLNFGERRKQKSIYSWIRFQSLFFVIFESYKKSKCVCSHVVSLIIVFIYSTIFDSSHMFI